MNQWFSCISVYVCVYLSPRHLKNKSLDCYDICRILLGWWENWSHLGETVLKFLHMTEDKLQNKNSALSQEAIGILTSKFGWRIYLQYNFKSRRVNSNNWWDYEHCNVIISLIINISKWYVYQFPIYLKNWCSDCVNKKDRNKTHKHQYLYNQFRK